MGGGGGLLVYPAQPPCALDGKPCPDFVNPDPAIYESNTPFPSTTTTISFDTVSFGYHVVSISFCPFEYLPKDRKLFRFEEVSITINYMMGAIEYQRRITQYRHELIQNYIKSIVQNPIAISSSQKTANQIVNFPTPSHNSDKLIIPWQPNAQGYTPDYVVITNNALKLSWQPFVQSKIQRGIPTVLVTVEDIYANYSGTDNPEKIRNYLKKAYEFWVQSIFI